MPCTEQAAGRSAVLLLASILALVGAAHAACGGGGHTSGTDPASLARSRAVLESNGIAVDKDYRARRLVAYSSGAGMVWVQRVVRGVPVFMDELAFHFDAQQRVKRNKAGKPILGGEAEPLARRDFDPAPRIDSETAKKAFAQRAKTIYLTGLTGRPAGSRPGPDYTERLGELDAELGIYRGHLAWRVCPREGGNPYGYFSADDAGELFFFSGIVS